MRKRSTEIAQKEIKTPDLSEAIAKRIEGDLETAIQILRKQNDEFPDSHEILVQLGRSLFDAENFALAAFASNKHFPAVPRMKFTASRPKRRNSQETTKTLWQISKNIYRFSRTKKGLG